MLAYSTLTLPSYARLTIEQWATLPIDWVFDQPGIVAARSLYDPTAALGEWECVAAHSVYAPTAASGEWTPTAAMSVEQGNPVTAEN